MVVHSVDMDNNNTLDIVIPATGKDIHHYIPWHAELAIKEVLINISDARDRILRSILCLLIPWRLRQSISRNGIDNIV